MNSQATNVGTNRTVQLIGHRGSAALAPENTLASLATALELGMDAVEIDVHPTSDGVLVVIHDDSVDRTTEGSGRVHDLSLADVKRLDAGAGFYGPAARRAWDQSWLRIPTLQEVVDLVRGRAMLVIELKDPRQYPGIEEQLVTELQHLGMLGGEERRVLLLSFSVAAVRKFAELAPEEARFQLLPPREPITNDTLDAVATCAHGVGPHVGSVDADLVHRAHSRDLLVIPYTANDFDEAVRLLRLGVDGLIGDNPVILRRAVVAEVVGDAATGEQA